MKVSIGASGIQIIKLPEMQNNTAAEGFAKSL